MVVVAGGGTFEGAMVEEAAAVGGAEGVGRIMVTGAVIGCKGEATHGGVEGRGMETAVERGE